jgi:hypothetical protein
MMVMNLIMSAFGRKSTFAPGCSIDSSAVISKVVQ